MNHMDEDKVIQEIVTLKDDVRAVKETMATKEDIRKMTHLLEGIATICKKIQEDHVFAIEWLKRLQSQIERQEDDIRQIKLRLQMA